MDGSRPPASGDPEEPSPERGPEKIPEKSARDSSEGPVAWIETVSEDDAAGELRELYAAERDPRTGRVDHILRVHSLHPASLRDHAHLYHTILHGPSGLSRAEREMMGVVVSALNGCEY